MNNQRLKSLLEEVGFVGYGEDAGFYKVPVPAFLNRMDRFTELIIQECCDQVRAIDAMEIRKHFGITPKHHDASEWPREL